GHQGTWTLQHTNTWAQRLEPCGHTHLVRQQRSGPVGVMDVQPEHPNLTGVGVPERFTPTKRVLEIIGVTPTHHHPVRCLLRAGERPARELLPIPDNPAVDD